eukprot:6089828-Pyramimonas_sp.AAC.1
MPFIPLQNIDVGSLGRGRGRFVSVAAAPLHIVLCGHLFISCETWGEHEHRVSGAVSDTPSAPAGTGPVRRRARRPPAPGALAAS